MAKYSIYKVEFYSSFVKKSILRMTLNKKTSCPIRWYQWFYTYVAIGYTLKIIFFLLENLA